MLAALSVLFPPLLFQCAIPTDASGVSATVKALAPTIHSVFAGKLIRLTETFDPNESTDFLFRFQTADADGACATGCRFALLMPTAIVPPSINSAITATAPRRL